MRAFFAAYAWLLLVTGVAFTGVGIWQTYHRAEPLLANQVNTPVLGAYDVQLSNKEHATKEIATQAKTNDARALIVADFLQRHNSPLTPHEYYGQVFVDLADKHSIDFRLLPAIAMQESNLCKRIPPGSYNCLGFGIHERGTLHFESYEANFDRAGRELKAFYINEGRLTPEDIMRKYTPSSDGSWADSVNQWMAEMKYNDRQKGREVDENYNVLEYVVPTENL